MYSDALLAAWEFIQPLICAAPGHSSMVDAEAILDLFPEIGPRESLPGLQYIDAGDALAQTIWWKDGTFWLGIAGDEEGSVQCTVDS